MQAWGPQGHVTLDFARRQVTLAQPTVGSGQGASLEVQELDCNRGDQLTRELQDFIHAVRTGTPPRVRGEQGRDALALAMCILEHLAAHGETIVPPLNRAA
jgi:predicted dehydrogenase